MSKTTTLFFLISFKCKMHNLLNQYFCIIIIILLIIYSVSMSIWGRTGSGTSVDDLEQCSWASQIKSQEWGKGGSMESNEGFKS
jgi:hypothetical protein